MLALIASFLVVCTGIAPRSASAAAGCEKGVAPGANAVFVEEGPTIDGILDDPIWERAEVITDLTQVEPANCVPESFRTEIRILTDGDFLYISFRGHDPEPGQIVANRMARNERFFYDDGFSIFLDTFHDRQNGYFFQVNPNGGRRDGTFAGDSFEENWEGIWYAGARVDSEGWTAEVAIPFKTVGFRPDADVWGLNFTRRIRRFNEEDRWADPSLQRAAVNMSRAGTLHGMDVARQGIGLDVVPTFSIGAINDGLGDDFNPADPVNRDADDHSELRVEPSFDAFYRVLPSLTASVTANTDFGTTEVDEVQLNLTRFNPFFPEKREFFLRDSGIFRFGDLDSENGIPFFSRRIGLFEQIGLVEDEFSRVRILGGGRVTGRLDRFNVGFIDIQQDRNNGREGENLAVARVSANVLEESNMGFLLTHGDPNSEEENLLAGVDFNYRSSQLIENRFVLGSAWLQQVFSGGSYSDRKSSWGGTVAYPNDRYNWELRFKDIQENFDPALGFVNRDDIRVYDADYRFRIRSQKSAIRTFDMLVDSSLTTDRTDHIESVRVILSPFRLTTQVEDSLELQYLFLYEDTVQPFYLAEHIGVPPGEYGQSSVILRLKTSQHRPVRFDFTTGIGEFFDGWGVRFAPLLQWRPSKYLLFSTEFDERIFYDMESCYGGATNCVSGPTGDVEKRTFHIRLARFRVQVAFSPNVSWSSLVQYDNISDDLEFQTRFNWIIEPGKEFSVVVGQDFDAEPGDFRVRRTQPAVRLRWTFRF